MQELLLIIFKQKPQVKSLKAMKCQMVLSVLTVNNQTKNVMIMKLDIVVQNHNINVKMKIGLLGSIEITHQVMEILKL